MTGTVDDLLAGDLEVVTAGPALFTDALAEQGVPARAVAWRPPLAPPDPVARVMGDPRRRAANAAAVSRMTTARPHLVDVGPAREVLGIEPGTFLHAGPPLDVERLSGPMRGALLGAAIYEGLADDVEQAGRALASASFAPCHGHGAVGSMAGVITPSMWVWVVEDSEHGGRAASSLLEGQGEVLAFGSHGPAVVERLRWMERVLGPALRAAVRAHGPLDLDALRAQALQMGDELHNRNRAATGLLLRALAGPLARTGAYEVLDFVAGNDMFFLPLSMAAAKAAADAARAVPGSSLVVAMARNGTDFGLQLSGTGDAWHVGPAAMPDGLYLGGYGAADASPDIGDSAVTETVGFGGFAMAASPAIVRFVGGEVSDALAATRRMAGITLAEHPSFRIPALDFRGTPTGVDVTAVVRSGVLPVITTGIAGREPGTGQIGAGVTTPPSEAFVAALRALAERVPEG